MSLIIGVLVAIGTFAVLVFGLPVIFASSGGGLLLSMAIAYLAGFAARRGQHKRLAQVVLVVVLLGVAYSYLQAVERRPPPFPGAAKSGFNQPTK